MYWNSSLRGVFFSLLLLSVNTFLLGVCSSRSACGVQACSGGRGKRSPTRGKRETASYFHRWQGMELVPLWCFSAACRACMCMFTVNSTNSRNLPFFKFLCVHIRLEKLRSLSKAWHLFLDWPGIISRTLYVQLAIWFSLNTAVGNIQNHKQNLPPFSRKQPWKGEQYQMLGRNLKQMSKVGWSKPWELPRCGLSTPLINSAKIKSLRIRTPKMKMTKTGFQV